MTTSREQAWKIAHSQAWFDPRGVEAPMVHMLKAWLDYAETHEFQYESQIGDDYVLGDEWAKIGFALRALLNGDLGRLDGGTLDSLICNMLDAQGWDCDTEERKPS